MDPLAQVVHVVEVLFPALIDRLQQQVALKRAHQLITKLFFARIIERHCLGNDALLQRGAIKVAGEHARGGQLVVERADRHQVGKRDEQPGQVPIFDVVARRVFVDQTACNVADLGPRLLTKVCALENLVAVGVNDAALLVHHVVVLEHALADQEVLLLNLALRFFDLLREHSRLDRFLVAFLVGPTEAVENLVDPVAGKKANEIVLCAEEETRFAGISLTAGAAAQLVVDPARLVPLGANNEEASRLEHFFARVGNLRLLLDDQRRHLLSKLRLVRLYATGNQLFAREVLRAAAKLDVDATASHVGGDCDGAGAAGFGDDLALALGVLGLCVKNGVRDSSLREH